MVDENYEQFDLSRELAGVVLEARIPVKYARVCTQSAIAYTRGLGSQILTTRERIMQRARELMAKQQQAGGERSTSLIADLVRKGVVKPCHVLVSSF